MTISFQRYIDITSSVGATGGAVGRQFIGRLFTTNELLPPKTLIQFNNAEQVGDYFGTSSEEYARAVFYFGWISKNITTPQAISYARWVDVASPPIIFGAVKTQSLATYQAIADGSLSITIEGDTQDFTGLDFTTALSLADVALVIQNAIQAVGTPAWATATVTWEATDGYFKFVGGNPVPSTISVAEGVVGTPIADTLGWLIGATLSNGAAVETITETLEESWNASNNFGTFLFIPSLTLDEIVEAAQWTSQQNIRVMYTVPVALADAASYRTALASYDGVEITLSETAGEYPEQAPMMIFAATNYGSENSVQNFMFQQFDLTPSVSDDATADLLDSLLINYYGVTQQAGQQIAFYQRGKLQGQQNSPSDINVYANEIWLKDSAGVALMNLFLAFAQIPANAAGATQCQTVLTSVIQKALLNGTIEAGKNLTDLQKLYIGQVTNDPDAYQQVQTLGYWLNCVIETTTVGSSVEYKLVYVLVYSKDDVIRKAEGTHILI